MVKARELIKGNEDTPSIKEMTELIEIEEKNESVKMDWLIQRIEGLGVEKNKIEIEKIKGVNFITIRSQKEFNVEEIIKFTRGYLDKKSKEIQENALILMRAVKVMIGEFNMGNSSVCDVKSMFVTQAASQTTYHLARITMEAVKRMNSEEGVSRMQTVKLFGEKIEGEGAYLIQIDGMFNESIAFGRDMTKEMMLSLIKRNKKISELKFDEMENWVEESAQKAMVGRVGKDTIMDAIRINFEELEIKEVSDRGLQGKPVFA
jgi:hypothetical protein